MEASEPLRPPGYPGTLEEFKQQVSADPEAWYDFISQAEAQISQLDSENSALRVKALELHEQTKSQEKELEKQHLKLELHREEYDRLQQKLVISESEKAVATARATATSIPNVYPAQSTPTTTPAENIPAAPLPTTTPIAYQPSETSRISERVPDPSKFTGDRSDLSRFVEHTRAKLTINSDRFPTPQERNVYVLSRLEGLAYQQVRPYIRFGIPQFPDYGDILDLLERAFGDPNLASRSTQKLHQIRQQNKDFNVFYAEFQRLALDSGLDDIALVPILERAISRELKQLLVTSKPERSDIHSLASHLQDLDTRHRYLFSADSYRQSNYTNKNGSSSSRPTSPAPPYTSVTPRLQGDPIDLSNTRRRPDKETGNCFRCHQPGHRIRECPQPDTRPPSVQRRDSDARKYRMSVMSARSPSPSQSPRNRFAVLQPSPVRPATPAFAPNQITESENRVRLR
jgi:hypothetical protein